MTRYQILYDRSGGKRVEEVLAFVDDDAAISYALPLARGSLVEIRRGGRLIATVDERPCLCA